MIPNICIEIHTQKFPILEGEEDELVNEGMYGKALCQYLQMELPKVGIEVPSYVCEDWGWWIDVKDNDFAMGLCVYSHSLVENQPEKYAIMSSITKGKKWSWSKWRTIDVTEQVTTIMDRVETIFRNDSEIDHVARHDDFPF